MSLEREQIGACTLYRGDCREILPTLTGIGAVVTDPPYGIGYCPTPKVPKVKWGRHVWTNPDWGKIEWDTEPFDPHPWLDYPCVLWGANNYATRLYDGGGWLAWYKGDGTVGYRMSACELAWCSEIRGVLFLGYLWHGYKRAGQNGEKVQHPTEKPVAVMAWSVGVVPGTSILDPFMGSGTTGIACVQLGRSFVGVEIEPRYFDTACQRITAAYAQPDLFVPTPARPVQQDIFAEACRG